MSAVWSGGVAFSYFPASSVQGQFGMVTPPQGGTDGTVQTSEDFDRLQQQYSQVQPPNSPSMSEAGNPTYPACPTTNSSWVASNTLPPTPNLADCECLERSLGCQFTPATANFSVIVGDLLNFGCSQIGQRGVSCDDIGGNGQTGVYGRVSACDPTVKTSYVMSQYMEQLGSGSKDQQACSFNGNGTINASASVPASSAASTCITNPSATGTPTAPGASSASSGTGSSNGNSGSTGGSNNGSPALYNTNSLVGIGAVTVITLASGIWTIF